MSTPNNPYTCTYKIIWQQRWLITIQHIVYDYLYQALAPIMEFQYVDEAIITSDKQVSSLVAFRCTDHCSRAADKAIERPHLYLLTHRIEQEQAVALVVRHKNITSLITAHSRGLKLLDVFVLGWKLGCNSGWHMLDQNMLKNFVNMHAFYKCMANLMRFTSFISPVLLGFGQVKMHMHGFNEPLKT